MEIANAEDVTYTEIDDGEVINEANYSFEEFTLFDFENLIAPDTIAFNALNAEEVMLFDAEEAEANSFGIFNFEDLIALDAEDAEETEANSFNTKGAGEQANSFDTEEAIFDTKDLIIFDVKDAVTFDVMDVVSFNNKGAFYFSEEEEDC